MRGKLADPRGGARTLRASTAHRALGIALLLALPYGAWAADDVIGRALPGQINLLPAVTPIAEDIHLFHNYILLPIITIICLFVLALLAYIVVKFNDRANPTPSRTTHHAGLEVAWTVVPVLILVIIAIPSFRLLTKQLVIPKADVTVKVTGKQWYWSYEYPKDQGGGFGFDSIMIPESDLKPDDLRLLTVDNVAVVPVNRIVNVQVTAADVIHSFVIQSFGIRIDAVPGRLNQTWFKAEREGMYYGQCSKLCGKDHSFMPIGFRVVSDEQYSQWLNEAKKKFASGTGRPTAVAVNASP
jgi:cytochrome c oxidase subunit 2